MRITSMQLTNFRCYKSKTIIDFDNLTVLIGKNDIGKSTILEALDAFFNDKIDSKDLSKNSDNQTIEIKCTFTDIPKEIILDTKTPTSPSEEGILNAENQLEIKKVYNFGARKTTSVFIIANHPSNPKLIDILSKTNPQLKTLAEEVNADLSTINKSKNPSIREKIREVIGGDRKLIEIKVDGNLSETDNLKGIWSGLKKYLPIFSLFKVDKNLDDKDDDIQDPMKVAIEEALASPEIKDLLDQVEEKVRQVSTEVADQTISKLKAIDSKLSETLKSEFSKSPSYNRIFDLTLLNKEGIPLNKRGSGIRRLVLLSFFQAQAERKKDETFNTNIIYALEEPETSQHPNHQQMLISSLINLGGQQGVQVIFTTHSANLVKEIPQQSLRFISSDGNDGTMIEYGTDRTTGLDNQDVIEKIIQTLGILPNPADKVKLLLYLEGNNDINALKGYSRILHKTNPKFINLDTTDKVAFVITGGSSLKHYVDKKYLGGLGKPEMHIYDNDVKSYSLKVKEINEENNPKRIAFLTNKRELENYLHADAIEDAYLANGQSYKFCPIDDQLDVPLMVAKTIKNSSGGDWNDYSDKKQGEIISAKKRMLNDQAVDKMTYERLEERRAVEEISIWLKKIEELCNLG